VPQAAVTPEEFGKMISQGMWSGIWMAVKLLWPFFLLLLVAWLVKEYLLGWIDRAKRDAEYRRMAKIFKEENEKGSSRGGVE